MNTSQEQLNKESNNQVNLQKNTHTLVLLLACFPGLILSVHFVLLSALSVINTYKTSSIHQLQLQTKSNTAITQIEALEKKIDEKIELISDQQQNFIANGQGTLNFLLTVILVFAGYNAYKESFLNPKEKKEIREELKDKIQKELAQELKPELAEQIKQELSKEIEDLKKNIQQISIDKKWLEYEISVISAEQLENKPFKEKHYYILAALYQHLRAIQVLEEISQEDKSEHPKRLYAYEIKSVKKNYKFIYENISEIPKLNTDQVSKFQEILKSTLKDSSLKQKLEEVIDQTIKDK